MDICSLTVHETSELIRKKDLSVKDVTKAYLDRIESKDTEIGSYITVCSEEALKKAEMIQKKIDNNEASSKIAGIPFALKDNMCTKGIKTTCASKMLENFIPPYDATVVRKLNESDTVLLGKLNMDEFAMGGSTENSAIKKTCNPKDITRVPGGSSGGSAAAVAANLAGFSLGSDTGGSIRQPASFCGVVGMKPTYGTVSRFGLVAFASSLDQIGPLTKDVTDCALVMNYITGYDKMDSTSANIEYPDYTKFLDNDIKGMKIAIPKEYVGEGINDEVKNSILDTAKRLEAKGAIVDEVSLPITEYAIPAYYIISSAEASSNLARYDGIKYGYQAKEFNNLLELYKKTRSEGFGDEVKRRIMLGTYALSSGYYDAYYKKALKVRRLIYEGFMNIFQNYDLIMGPVAPTTAYRIGEKTDNPLEMYLGDIYTVSVNIAGLPGLSLPCGIDSNGLPIGAQLIAKPFGEGTIIKAGFNIEL